MKGTAGSGKEGRQQPWDDGEAGWDVRGIIVKECCTQSVAPRQKGLTDTFLNALQLLVLSSPTLTMSRWEEVREVGNRQCRKIIIST